MVEGRGGEGRGRSEDEIGRYEGRRGREMMM